MEEGTKGNAVISKLYQRSPPPCQISPPIGATTRVYDPKNWNFHSDLTKMWNINRGVSLARFWQNLQSLHPISGLDLLEGLWSYGGFQLRRSRFPKFSVPPSGETMRQTPSVGDARTCLRSSITMPSLVGLRFHSPPGWSKKTLSFFVCLSVCLFVTLLNVRDCAPDFAMKALEYRNDFDTVG